MDIHHDNGCEYFERKVVTKIHPTPNTASTRVPGKVFANLNEDNARLGAACQEGTCLQACSSRIRLRGRYWMQGKVSTSSPARDNNNNNNNRVPGTWTRPDLQKTVHVHKLSQPLHLPQFVLHCSAQSKTRWKTIRRSSDTSVKQS